MAPVGRPPHSIVPTIPGCFFTACHSHPVIRAQHFQGRDVPVPRACTPDAATLRDQDAVARSPGPGGRRGLGIRTRFSLGLQRLLWLQSPRQRGDVLTALQVARGLVG